jgi:hypothetical protein
MLVEASTGAALRRPFAPGSVKAKRLPVFILKRHSFTKIPHGISHRAPMRQRFIEGRSIAAGDGKIQID